jgi:hypothetical protein
VNRLDFFTGPGVSWSQKKIVGMLHLETGINRTIFQSAPFPRLSLAFGYNLMEAKKIMFTPLISYSVSALTLGKTAHFWNEQYLGYRISFGGSIRVFQESMLGLIQERFKNIQHEQFKFSNWGYFGSIGVSVALGN